MTAVGFEMWVGCARFVKPWLLENISSRKTTSHKLTKKAGAAPPEPAGGVRGAQPAARSLGLPTVTMATWKGGEGEEWAGGT